MLTIAFSCSVFYAIFTVSRLSAAIMGNELHTKNLGFTEIKAPPVHTTLQNVLAGGVFPVEASGGRSTVNLQPESCGKDL